MIVHLNGSLIAAGEARVSPFDRGFLFGDGVYEGLRATRGHIIGFDAHAERMRAGLAEARIAGFDPARLDALSHELLNANALQDGFIYWQVTRGTPRAGDAVRQRVPTPMSPTVFGYVTPLPPVDAIKEPTTRRAALRPDTRWERGWVKSISLLGGVLASIEADEQGCEDAILVRDGLVTEGTAANVFLFADGRMVTPSLDSVPMLAGVTRKLLIEADPTIVQRPVTVEELRKADEVMLVGTVTMVSSITHLDSHPVGRGAHAGAIGPAARRLLKALVRVCQPEGVAGAIH